MSNNGRIPSVQKHTNTTPQSSANSTKAILQEEEDNNESCIKVLLERDELISPLPITIIMYILGVATMLPWNFFLTANSFWQYKLRNTTLGDSWDDPDVDLTRLQVAFTPAFVIISNSVCFIFGFFTSAIAKRVSEKIRIYTSLFISLIAMCIITLLTFINTDDWQEAFFGIVLIIVALYNIGIAVLQASLYGMVGFFPSSCIAALVSGQSVAGVISSVAQIISLAIGQEDPVTTGIIYFCLADVYLAITIWAYFWIRRMKFYNDRIKKETNEKNEKLSMEEYFRVLKKVFWIGSALGFVLLVTLSVFPSVQVYITSIHAPSTWADVYFQPTITFLLFNVFDMIGRELTRWITWPGHEGYLYYVLSFSRIVFIPLILLCYGDNKTFPTIFNYDFYYIIINILFALTNGYIGALAMIYYPRMVEKDEVELAGALMATLMAVGMVLGSCASPGFVALWGPKTD